MSLLLLAALALPQPPSEAPKPASTVSAAQAPTQTALGFVSLKGRFAWDTLLPVKLDVDGLKVNSVFVNRREISRGPLKGASFGVRAQVEVTNTSDKPRNPGFAIAILDAEDRLLGVASGAPTFRAIRPGETDTFDLSFSHVLERLPRGTSYILSVELMP